MAPVDLNLPPEEQEEGRGQANGGGVCGGGGGGGGGGDEPLSPLSSPRQAVESAKDIYAREREARIATAQKRKREAEAAAAAAAAVGEGRVADAGARASGPRAAANGASTPPLAELPPPPPSVRRRHAGPIPDGWLDCPPMGDLVYGLVPCKAPLGEAFAGLVDPPQRFSPEQLLRRTEKRFGHKVAPLPLAASAGRAKSPTNSQSGMAEFQHRDAALRPSIRCNCHAPRRIVSGRGRFTPSLSRCPGAWQFGLVVDLTNTRRYYHENEFRSNGVRYVKARLLPVPCRGRNEVPDNETVNQFVYEVMRFKGQQAAKDGGGSAPLVVVHCTHGHNRTGLMIAHYLMRTMSMHVANAISIFATARPPGIYKDDYIQSIFKSYHERRPESLHCPPVPDWKRTEEDDEDDDSDRAASQSVLGASSDGKVPEMTSDDVLGDAIPAEQQAEMQWLVYQGLELPLPGRGPLTFPGSQPVSLDKYIANPALKALVKNLKLLRQQYYYVTWKADGTRYMLFLTRHGCYLLDRNFRFRRLQMRFPLRSSNPGELGGVHNGTLLDGEMVIDVDRSSGKRFRRFLVYDLMVLNQRSLAKWTFSLALNVKERFSDRWAMIQKEIIDPRAREMASGSKKVYMWEEEIMKVRRKDFYDISAVGKLLKDFIPKLCHESDGLIFQGWDDPYVARTHEGLLKWKYAHMNSVDFLLKVGPFGEWQLFLANRSQLQQLVGAKLKFTEGVDTSKLVGKVIECAWNPDAGQWEYMRLRPDKEHPNAWHTYEKSLKNVICSFRTSASARDDFDQVMGSIHDNITEDVLLPEIGTATKLPMYVERLKAREAQAQAHSHPSRAPASVNPRPP
eukprot:SM000029S10560  [mRNA]  locus=s29:803350:809670:+ [translate_table: standard]